MGRLVYLLSRHSNNHLVTPVDAVIICLHSQGSSNREKTNESVA
jgi:hypothetical protein